MGASCKTVLLVSDVGIEGVAVSSPIATALAASRWLLRKRTLSAQCGRSATRNKSCNRSQRQLQSHQRDVTHLLAARFAALTCANEKCPFPFRIVLMGSYIIFIQWLPNSGQWSTGCTASLAISCVRANGQIRYRNHRENVNMLSTTELQLSPSESSYQRTSLGPPLAVTTSVCE